MAKFYELTREQRLAQLVADGVLDVADATLLDAQAPLADATAGHLTENQVGQLALPLGLVHQLTVNGVTREVAIATEEPSVVAAASNGARMVAAGGGVTATAPAAHILDAQIVYVGGDALYQQVRALQTDLPRVAATAHPSIVTRGGGLRNVTVTRRERFVTVTLMVDVQAAMGANIVNTIAEACAHFITAHVDQAALFAILTNASQQVTTATVSIPHAALATRDTAGDVIAARIALASEYAQLDAARAVTHNKGIMNGVAGAALALGNDTRALSASIHAYAGRGAGYAPLSEWRDEDGMLHGQISLPLPVGMVGGAISALPVVRVTQKLAQVTTVAEQQEVLAAVGLVQNLAALRALVGPGIQAGHMALAAGALAIAAGAVDAEVGRLTALLQQQPKNLATAKRLLSEIRMEDKN